jgi:hypothetical protein
MAQGHISLSTAAEETLATVPGKEKEITEDTSKKKDFNFQNIIGQKLSKAEKEELRDYALSCGYNQEHCSSAVLMTKA